MEAGAGVGLAAAGAGAGAGGVATCELGGPLGWPVRGSSPIVAEYSLAVPGHLLTNSLGDIFAL